MFAHDRRQRIMEKLYKLRSIHASELIEQFGVSFETIRRDLEYLEKQGLMQRVHGGAVLANNDYKKELPLSARELQHSDAKKELSETAVQMVGEGDAIAIDVATTNTLFARALKIKLQRLTVVTNSFPIAMELMDMPQYTLIFVGGVVHGEEQCTVGGFAESFTEQFHVDKFFMSASGVSLTEGITDFGVGEVQLKKRIMAGAQETIVLADSSKIGQVSLLHVCNLQDVSKVVTDSGVDPQTAESFGEHGCNIIHKKNGKINDN